MELPLIAPPGIPTPMALRTSPDSSLSGYIACANALQFGSNDICVAPSIVPPARQKPVKQATNLAIPGMTVHQALTTAPVADPGLSAVLAMANLILGLPGPPKGLTGSQVDQAVALNPSTVLLWVGANDALIAGLSGDFSRLTSIDRFYSSYKRLIDRLAKTDARLVVANVPDVTVIPYFMSAETLAAQSGFPIETVAAKLRINRRDYLRPCAVPIAIEILNNRANALPPTCGPTVPGLLFEPVPAVMKAGEADLLRAAVFAYNLVILERAIAHRATLVDTFSLLNRIKANGYIANGKKITMDFLGGFFTLDAMHPTNTGHAIIANEWIKTMNSRLGTNIPQVSVDNVAKNDPLVR